MRRLLLSLSVLASVHVHGAIGTVFYHAPSGQAGGLAVRAIGADGSNDRAVPIPLPHAACPTVSRDGRLLLITAADPVPVMFSQNVFSVDLASGAIVPITHYVDTVSDGITIYTNLANEPDFDTYSYYTSHLPNHKAYSPNGDRVAVLNLASVSGKQPGGIRLPATQSPVLEVFPVQQAFPIGEWLFAGAERTGVNQAGDGVDWHPIQEELVGTFRSDIPMTSNLGPKETEGTVIIVFASSGLSPMRRKLTNPTGREYNDFTWFYTVSESEHDYAPAISRDGSRVAYVRNVIGFDSRIGLQFLLTKSSIRIINYDGSGDRELLVFGNNLWVTKLAWSPDDTEIAFDVAPRLVLNGLELQMGDDARSEIHAVRVSDGSVRRIAAAPAAYPSWSPIGASVEPPRPPAFQATRVGDQIRMDLSNLVNGRQVHVESTTDLLQWSALETFQASGATHTLEITPSPQTPSRFFRIRVE